MRLTDQNQACPFETVGYGNFIALSAFGKTHYALKVLVNESRPYPAALIFNHPEVNGAPALMVHNNKIVLHLSDAMLEMSRCSDDIAFARHREVPGTILQTTTKTLLVTHFSAGDFIYVDLESGETQGYPESDYVTIMKWSVVRKIGESRCHLVSFPLKDAVV